MKAYVTGPTNGVPDLNLPAFDDAADRLEALGHSVYSAIRGDLNASADMLIEADLVVTLDDWQHSPACRTEVALAEALGKSIMPIADALRLAS